MGRHLTIITIALFIFIAGCQSSDNVGNDELAEYEVLQTSDETTHGDFVFRLKSEKEEYNQGEEVKLYGVIEYIGDQGEVTINHSSSAVLFTFEEKVRGYTIPDFVQEIGMESTLNKSTPYRTKYQKSGGHYSDQGSEDYVSFLQDFWDREDFPPGYYVVNGVADLAQGSERVKIEAEIDFKVLGD
ncbi:MAG TPA: hypothetical protein VK135_07775 [Candidatus Dormibacteraeota bacterium]|nr:hypothetical protein [Candidatus Dormibacteraeota bacterium]